MRVQEKGLGIKRRAIKGLILISVSSDTWGRLTNRRHSDTLRGVIITKINHCSNKAAKRIIVWAVNRNRNTTPERSKLAVRRDSLSLCRCGGACTLLILSSD